MLIIPPSSFLLSPAMFRRRGELSGNSSHLPGKGMACSALLISIRLRTWTCKCRPRYACLQILLTVQIPSRLTKIRIHSHQHHFMDNGMDSHFSKESVGAIACIGFTTVRDGNTPPGKDGVVNRVGRPNYDLEYMSRCADVSSNAVTKVLVEYIRGQGCIAGLTLYSSGLEVATKKQWGEAKHRPSSVKQEWQTPPSEDGSWVLVGFRGHSDLVISRIGAIWRRV